MRKRRREADVVITPEIRLADSEISRTRKNQQEDKKRRKKQKKKVDQDALLKPKKLRKKKQKTVATPTEHSEIDSDDPKKLKKIIDGLSDRLNEMTEIVQKLKKTSELLEKEKETPEEKVVECFYESKDAFMKHRRSIFVRGFNCSFPKDEIKSTLVKHFSSCGEVARVSIPFHCRTGSPMGFAFINMVKDEEKALTLDGSYLGGLRLEVTMAVDRSEYYTYTGRLSCKRCRVVLMNRRMEDFYDFPTVKI